MKRLLLWVGTVLILPSMAARVAAGPPVSRPNVVVILADDLGYGDLACYGHPRLQDPASRPDGGAGSAHDAVQYADALLRPTRAALLTGRYPFRCGLTTNPDPESGPVSDAIALPAGEITLAQLLHDAGYATGMVGKWHLGHKKPEHLPTRRGFDEYFGIPYSNDMRPVKLLDGEREVEYPVVQTTLTRRYTERALRFIDRHRDRPFFLYFAHAMPHKPLACSEAFYKKSGAGLYGDALAELDWSVGQVLARLKDLGLDDRTLVVFTSDNGPWYGGSTGGLRGMKATTWEGGFRVPCIVRWPGRVPVGRVCAELAVTMDLFATALAATGVAPTAGRMIDGQDLLPVLGGAAHSGHDVIFGHDGPRLATVRDRRWKLHVLAARDRRDGSPGKPWIDFRAPDGVTILAPFEQCQPNEYPGLRTGDETGAMSLFDLEGDPGEQHNVAARYPEIVDSVEVAVRSGRSGYEKVGWASPTDASLDVCVHRPWAQ